MDTEREHEATRAMTLAGGSVLRTFTINQQLELPKIAAAEQYTVQIVRSPPPPPRFSSAGQDAGLRQHSRHNPLWKQSAKITVDSIGDDEITRVSPLSD